MIFETPTAGAQTCKETTEQVHRTSPFPKELQRPERTQPWFLTTLAENRILHYEASGGTNWDHFGAGKEEI